MLTRRSGSGLRVMLKAGLRVDKIKALLGPDAPMTLDQQLDRFLKELAGGT